MPLMRCGAAGIDRNKICVIGHSVGATIAIRLAAAQEWLAAAVLLRGAARSGLEVMRQQSERIAATLPWWRRPRRFMKIQDRERQRLLESRDDVIAVEGQGLPARWFREYMHYDPAPDLSRIACPVLAITGRSDVQVDCRDVEQMGRTVCSEFTGYKPEHLTHLLRIDAGPPRLRTYPGQMRRPVDGGALNVRVAWRSAGACRRCNHHSTNLTVLGAIADTQSSRRSSGQVACFRRHSRGETWLSAHVPGGAGLSRSRGHRFCVRHSEAIHLAHHASELGAESGRRHCPHDCP